MCFWHLEPPMVSDGHLRSTPWPSSSLFSIFFPSFPGGTKAHWLLSCLAKKPQCLVVCKILFLSHIHINNNKSLAVGGWLLSLELLFCCFISCLETGFLCWLGTFWSLCCSDLLSKSKIWLDQTLLWPPQNLIHRYHGLSQDCWPLPWSLTWLSLKKLTSPHPNPLPCYVSGDSF